MSEKQPASNYLAMLSAMFIQINPTSLAVGTSLYLCSNMLNLCKLEDMHTKSQGFVYKTLPFNETESNSQFLRTAHWCTFTISKLSFLTTPTDSCIDISDSPLDHEYYLASFVT